MVALSILFGGSTSIIFAAMALIHAAKERGIPIAQAATENAPMFTMFSAVVGVCALTLLLAESLHYAAHRSLTPMVKARYASSVICIAAAAVLNFGIIPGMEQITIKAYVKSGAAGATMQSATEKKESGSEAKTPDSGDKSNSATPPVAAKPSMTDEEHADFKKLHELSRVVFMVIIVTAFVSLLLPGFDSAGIKPAPKPEEKQVAAS
jgi:hypothetical protein